MSLPRMTTMSACGLIFTYIHYIWYHWPYLRCAKAKWLACSRINILYGSVVGCAWNGVLMASMCWAAATISKQCSVLCFAMAVFIAQQAWLEKRTRAMQQLHLQNDLTYQVCSQQFKNRNKSVVCCNHRRLVEHSWRALPGSCGISVLHVGYVTYQRSEPIWVAAAVECTGNEAVWSLISQARPVKPREST